MQETQNERGEKERMRYFYELNEGTPETERERERERERELYKPVSLL